MASVQEYQERNVAISAEIEKLKAQNESLMGTIVANKARAVDWRNSKSDCKKVYHPLQTQKIKECNQENDRKEAIAAGSDALVKSSNATYQANLSKINQLNTEFQKNIELIASAQKSSEQVAKELSLQGTTTEAVQTKSNAESEALLLAAKASSDAQAEAVKMEAEANASNKKKIGMVIAIVVGGVALVGALILVKKLRKKKK
ncbi:MAG: hypothetical protein M9916_00870 [Crocinitomicaceae bacterium]|nr:hypothetical protein [Crocinitomicaceae bacterium]